MITPSEAKSPSLDKRRLDHVIELEDIEAQNKLSSCCGGSTDKRLLDHISRLVVSILVLGFTFAQLIRAEKGSEMIAFYSSLLTFILGTWSGNKMESIPSIIKKPDNIASIK